MTATTCLSIKIKTPSIPLALQPEISEREKKKRERKEEIKKKKRNRERGELLVQGEIRFTLLGRSE